MPINGRIRALHTRIITGSAPQSDRFFRILPYRWSLFPRNVNRDVFPAPPRNIHRDVGDAMYSDYRTKVNEIQCRMLRNTRIACFVGASLLHFVASTMLLALQTSCAYPRCVDGIAFEIFRAAMHVPLFSTPWLGLPSPDLDFVRDPILAVWLALNAVMAVALCWGTAIAGYRGFRYWRARQWEKLRAAQRER